MATDFSPLLTASDKSFWHGYIEFYDRHLPRDLGGAIVELGVFRGHSIRWLADKYPNATIHGVDILPQQDEWPTSNRIRYSQVDQASESAVRKFFEDQDALDLIIEDGSHVPEHQSRCLRLGWKALKPGGIYVLEDIHTSHPDHPLLRSGRSWREGLAALVGGRDARQATSLSLILAMEHLKRVGCAVLRDEVVDQLARGTHFRGKDVTDLYGSLGSVAVHRRSTLPSKCYRCGSSDYDYNAYKCRCGVDLLSGADSMSVILTKE